MAISGTTVKKIRTVALDLGVYLPVGAAMKARDTLLSRDQLAQTYRSLVERGRDGLATAVDRTESNLERAKDQAERARAEARGRTMTAVRVTGARAGVPPAEEQLPIKGYSELTAQKVIAELPKLGQDDLRLIQAYERANQNRTSVQQAIDARLVDLPIDGYDRLTAEEIADELSGLSDDDLRTVREYERRGPARKTILDRIESLLAA